MRHNPSDVSLSLVPAEPPVRGKPFRLARSLALLTLIALPVTLAAEKPPAERAKNDQTRQTQAKQDKKIDEIDQSWMQAIHAGKPNETAPADSNAPQQMQDPGPAPAPETTTRPAQPASLFPEEERPSFVSTLVRFLGMFLLMVAIFYAVMRYLKSRSVGGSMGDLARTLGSVALAPGKHLQVIDLAGKILVLGVSDAGVQLITAVDDARTAERIRQWHENKPSVPTPETLLQKLILILRGSDLKFWNKAKPVEPTFRYHLDSVIPADQTPAQDPGLFGAEDELRKLLRDQKNRLAKIREPAIKKRKETGGEFVPGT